MKLLISTGIFPNRVAPHRGIYILRQATALAKKAGVMVIAPVPFFPAFARSARYSPYSRVPRKDTIDGIEVLYPRYYVIPKILRFAHGVMLESSVYRTFREVTRQFRPDAILGFYAYPYGFATVRIARRLGIPVVTGVLGSDLNVMPRGSLHRRMIQRTLRSSDRVFSVCASLKAKAVELGADPAEVAVITNGIEGGRYGRLRRGDARAKLGLDEQGRFVLCVSNLVPVKGVDILVRAFAGVPEDVRLVVVGDGEQSESIRRLAEGLGLDRRVRLAGKRPPEDVPLWMAAADLLVVSSRAEGHPNVVLEALASGTPVVATRVGGVPEILRTERHGVIVPPEDPVALTEGIRTALATDWDEDFLRREGQSRTWDDVASDILAELDGIIAANRRPLAGGA
jgi:glycosyltransferase involved in cell wall biosynthesis